MPAEMNPVSHAMTSKTHTRRQVLRSGIATAIALGVAGCAGFSNEFLGESIKQNQEWPQYRYDPANSGVNPAANGLDGKASIKATFGSADWMEIPTIVENSVYVSDGGVHVLGPQGEERLKAGINGTEIAVADGTAFVGSIERGAFALDATTGTTQWNRQIGRVFPPTLADQSL
ncbi:MAG: hypothetical protein ABEI52_06505, partial [Halobacteriaceae archaeon]